MNYINEKAQLITVDGNLAEGEYRFIDTHSWKMILDKLRFHGKMLQMADLVKIYSYKPPPNGTGFDIPSLLKTYSSPLFFDKSIAEFRKMINYVANDKSREHEGFMVFNYREVKVYFGIDNNTANVDSRHVGSSNIVGGSFNSLSGTIVLASLHTHPEEEHYRQLSVSDQKIFGTQYEKRQNYLTQDGYVGIATRSPIYSMGMNSVDYYSPGGYRRSKNNLCSNLSLINGSFNILKHALHEYCTWHYF